MVVHEKRKKYDEYTQYCSDDLTKDNDLSLMNYPKRLKTETSFYSSIRTCIMNELHWKIILSFWFSLLHGKEQGRPIKMFKDLCSFYLKAVAKGRKNILFLFDN